MTVVTLRDAQCADIDTLVGLDAGLFGHDAWNEASWWEEFAQRPRRRYVVATAGDGTIVGYAGLDVAGTTADVMTVAVAPAAQGRGTGRVLMDHLLEAARSAGAEALMLEVRADNGPALRLYESLGFDRLTVRRRYYQPGDVDAVIMRKLLETT